jgi:DNA polymerase-3 subunit alpha
VEFSVFHNFKGVAVVDTLSTYGFFKLTKLCNSRNIKPVYGLEIFTKGVSGRGHYPFILIALNNQGLSNIFKLNSYAQELFQKDGSYTLPFNTVQSHSEGLCAIVEAEFVFHLDNYVTMQRIGERYMDTFGKNFFLEVNYTGHKKVEVLKELISRAESIAIPAIGCCEARYFHTDREAFEFLNSYRMKSHSKNERGLPLDIDMDYSVRKPEDMENIFKNHPDYIENAQNLFESIDVNLDIKSFKIPQVYKYPEKLRDLCMKRLEKLKLSDNKEYLTRLDYELSVIEELELNHFFLIVGDIARFMQNRRIPFGWGRGSSVSSLTLYLLGITKVDPVLNNLMFERFLNPARKELPDIDIDVCWKRRKEVFEYVATKFGQKNVAHISTLGRLMARSALREIAKAFKLSKIKLDAILKQIPFTMYSYTRIKNLIKTNRVLRDMIHNDPEVRSFLDIVSRIEGIVSHSSVHAGGFVVLPMGIDKYASSEYSRSGELVVQITKDDLDGTGFIKIDLLGLRFVTIIDETMRHCGIDTINFEDHDAKRILSEGDTTAVFQLESGGMRDLLKKIRPENISRLSDVIALYRPGPIKSGMLDEYVKRHNGITPAVSDKYLGVITSETYGLIVYQEQILQIAHNFGGMGWDRADILRKALSNKDEATIIGLKDEFIRGCLKKGLEEEYANRIFGILVDFGSYGFNRSHSLAYAYNAFAGAYLKANYPLEFYLSSLNNNIGFVSRLNRYISDMKLHNYTVFGVDINKSGVLFRIEMRGIRVGFIIVKYVGRRLARAIVKERNNNGDFRDLLDFYIRMKDKGLNIKAAEYLIRVGAFDNQGFSRNALIASLNDIVKIKLPGEDKTDAHYEGTLFDKYEKETVNNGVSLDALIPKELRDDSVSDEERKIEYFEMENSATDLFLTFHPIDIYREEIERLEVDCIADIEKLEYIVAVAYLYKLRITKTKSKASMAFCLLSDNTGIAEAVIFPKTFSHYSGVIKKNSVYLVKGGVKDGKITIEEIYPFDRVIRH